MSIDLNQTSVREICASNDTDMLRGFCCDETGAVIMSVGIVRKIKRPGYVAMPGPLFWCVYAKSGELAG